MRAGIAGPGDQPVAVDGVRLALDLVAGIVEAGGCGDIDDALAVGVVALDRSEFGDEIILAAHALARHPGVEQIRAEAHRDRNLGLERDRLFQITLAHVAPGANHVGNHVDR